jgi:predicted regulator of Ras-like GTPase activity (Roadblock/LC7/MglB family)
MNPSLPASGTRSISAAEFRALCDSELKNFCTRHSEASLALVATADAWLISSHSSEKTDANRLSAITASLLALCESLSKELSGGSCRSVLLSMNSYTCVIAHITGTHRPMVLAVGVRQDVMLALARRFALDLAERISSALHMLASGTTRSA